jgi:hypothetical protein
MTLPAPMTTHTPAELAKLAQNLWKAQQKLKAAQAKLNPLKEAADALEQELLNAMMAAKLESLASKNATISIKRNTFAELYDDRKFFEYVGKHKAWDLVAKRPVIGACRARWEDNLEIPGVRPGTRIDLSVTTRSK